ncbi:MAG: exodeoxyribonuclease VII small subunit [Paludibacteraceae bacterium]|nr:exodeoxyribonuclease VII small subunit [Paludibacteraceae bacterium]
MAGKKAENKELNYTESVERLEGIVKKIESGEMDIDQLTSQVAEAANLIKACKEKLFSTNEVVEKLLKELDK